MTTNDDNPDGRPVARYEEKRDDKGRLVWRPVYIKETPKETIQAMNEKFNEWKTTKQVKYDKNGMRIED